MVCLASWSCGIATVHVHVDSQRRCEYVGQRVMVAAQTLPDTMRTWKNGFVANSGEGSALYKQAKFNLAMQSSPANPNMWCIT